MYTGFVSGADKSGHDSGLPHGDKPVGISSSGRSDWTIIIRKRAGDHQQANQTPPVLMRPSVGTYCARSTLETMVTSKLRALPL
ncbi:unnamed protein product [Gadus morhua 'NCC']